MSGYRHEEDAKNLKPQEAPAYSRKRERHVFWNLRHEHKMEALKKETTACECGAAKRRWWFGCARCRKAEAKKHTRST